MDSPKPPSVEVQLQKFRIPTFLKQYYSLPSPIIKYMSENASAINYLKLFQTCKILQNFIQEKYGPQIDILEVGNFNNHSYFFSIHARNKEIKIRGSEKICNGFPKDQKLWVRKRLLFKRLSEKVTSTYLEKLNFSTVKEVYLLQTHISIEDYKKLLVPSIELLYGNALPNLKVFRLPWNSDLTTFAEITSVKRSQKLKKAEIYEFPLESDKDNLNGFITEHMAPGSTLYLCFKYGVSKSAKYKYQNFADEFNMFSPSKIIIR
uniref:Uncharacterized protein n=1 Tax=Panagrolaimus sp. PS1159 TaxID=55785 RepID=A0AC35F6U9_9BILA